MSDTTTPPDPGAPTEAAPTEAAPTKAPPTKATPTKVAPTKTPAKAAVAKSAPAAPAPGHSPQAPFTLAIDIGGTGLKASVLDAIGAMVADRVR